MPGLASSFSLSEKRTAQGRDPDERNQTGILTPGFEPRSRLPSVPHAGRQWRGGSLYPVTVAQPSPICTGFPDNSCDVSKSRRPSYASEKILQTKSLARAGAKSPDRKIREPQRAELHGFGLIHDGTQRPPRDEIRADLDLVRAMRFAVEGHLKTVVRR